MQNIIELDEKGENYRILWGLVNGGRPTSELPSHLMNHEVKKGVTNVYHAHTTNVIALTFVLPLEDGDRVPGCISFRNRCSRMDGAGRP